MKVTQRGLHAINNVLSLFVICLALYIIGIPFIPEVTFALQAKNQPVQQLKTYEMPYRNRLIIPAIGVDTPILEGTTAATLDDGIWHRPKTSTPDKGGNTVLVGHRFLYTSGPHTFYFLPKLQLNDIITIEWMNKTYSYRVVQLQTVTPESVSIESNTEKPQLTLYTCTPLWYPTHRFVVTAEPL